MSHICRGELYKCTRGYVANMQKANYTIIQIYKGVCCKYAKGELYNYTNIQKGMLQICKRRIIQIYKRVCCKYAKGELYKCTRGCVANAHPFPKRLYADVQTGLMPGRICGITATWEAFCNRHSRTIRKGIDSHLDGFRLLEIIILPAQSNKSSFLNVTFLFPIENKIVSFLYK